MMKVFYSPARYRLDVEGHAGFAAMGTDVVCAAGSILFHTLARTLKARKVAGFTYNENMEGLIRRVECAPTDEQADGARIVFETIMQGFESLAKVYPEYVTLIVEDA